MIDWYCDQRLHFYIWCSSWFKLKNHLIWKISQFRNISEQFPFQIKIYLNWYFSNLKNNFSVQKKKHCDHFNDCDARLEAHIWSHWYYQKAQNKRQTQLKNEKGSCIQQHFNIIQPWILLNTLTIQTSKNTSNTISMQTEAKLIVKPTNMSVYCK